jgi:hypothetical protein
VWPSWAVEEQHHRKRKRCQLASSQVGLRAQLDEVELVLLLHRDGLQLPGLVATLHTRSHQLFDLLMNYDNNFLLINWITHASHVDFDLLMG